MRPWRRSSHSRATTPAARAGSILAWQRMSRCRKSRSHQTPVAAFMARQFDASTGHAVDAPLGTVTAGRQGKLQLVASWFAKCYGTGDGRVQIGPTIR